MRSVMFLASTVCALCLAAFNGLDLQAKCRCQRAVASSNRAARHQARADRKCQRRGVCAVPAANQQQPNGTYYNPYGGDSISPTAGASAPTPIKPPEWKVIQSWTNADGSRIDQECNGRSCRFVRIVPAKPVPDPAFKDLKPDPAEAEETKAETQAPEATDPNTSWFPPGVINGT